MTVQRPQEPPKQMCFAQWRTQKMQVLFQPTYKPAFSGFDQLNKLESHL